MFMPFNVDASVAVAAVVAGVGEMGETSVDGTEEDAVGSEEVEEEEGLTLTTQIEQSLLSTKKPNF